MSFSGQVEQLIPTVALADLNAIRDAHADHAPFFCLAIRALQEYGADRRDGNPLMVTLDAVRLAA